MNFEWCLVNTVVHVSFHRFHIVEHWCRLNEMTYRVSCLSSLMPTLLSFGSLRKVLHPHLLPNTIFTHTHILTDWLTAVMQDASFRRRGPPVKSSFHGNTWLYEWIFGELWCGQSQYPPLALQDDSDSIKPTICNTQLFWVSNCMSNSGCFVILRSFQECFSPWSQSLLCFLSNKLTFAKSCII